MLVPTVEKKKQRDSRKTAVLAAEVQLCSRMALLRSQMFQYAFPHSPCIDAVDARPRKRTSSLGMARKKPWGIPAAVVLTQYPGGETHG
jgi:hypothetical protein